MTTDYKSGFHTNSSGFHTWFVLKLMTNLRSVASLRVSIRSCKDEVYICLNSLNTLKKTCNNNKKAFTWCACIRDFTQQKMHFLIRPVMQNSCQDVQVCFGQLIFKKVSWSYREDRAMSGGLHFQNFWLLIISSQDCILMQINKLTCYEWYPVVCAQRMKMFTHLNNSWQVKHCNRQLGMGFNKLIGHGTSASWEDK